HQHRIKPAAATLTPRDSAKLMATLTQTLPGFIAKFSRERTRADAGGIGFDDAQNIAGCRWPDAGTTCRCAGNGVGAGDERIGSVIDIKQHALRALEQYAVAAFARFVEALPHRLGILQHGIGNLAQVGEQAFPVNRLYPETGAQRVMMRAKPVKLRSQIVQMGQIAHADRTAAHFIFIGWTNAAPRRANLAFAAGIFTHGVQIAVDGKDQRAVFGNTEIIRIDDNALPAQFFNLVTQMPRVQHYAVTDD